MTALPSEIAVKQVKDSVDHTIMWCTVILTVVGVVGTYAAVRTLREVKRQADTLEDHKKKFEDLAKAAEDNAKAAKDYASAAEGQRKLLQATGEQTEALATQAARQTELTQSQLELSHRPWIRVDVIADSPLTFNDNGCVLTLKVTMTNVGHSVAKHVSLWTDFAITGLHDPIQVRDRLCSVMKAPENEGSDYGWLLFPDQHSTELRPVIAAQENIQKALQMRIFQGLDAIAFHVVGCVDYQSALDTKKHHQTRFVYAVAYSEVIGGPARGAFDPSARRYFNIAVLPTLHGASAD